MDFEESIRKKRVKRGLAKQDADFVQNQESQLLENEGFVFVKNQNVNRLPKLNQESFAHIPDQKSDASGEKEDKTISSSNSTDDLFNCKCKIINYLIVNLNSVSSEESSSENQDHQNEYKIGNSIVSFYR